MELHFTGRHIELTPALKTKAAEKFQKLDKFKIIKAIDLVLHVEKENHIAEATLQISGTRLHAAASDSDMYVAIDQLVDKLKKLITKHKEKITDHR